MDKPPFSIRKNPERYEDYFALREEIPEYLVPSLLAWGIPHYSRSVQGEPKIDQDQVHRLERKRRQLISDDARASLAGLQHAFVADHALLLDAIDIVLHRDWGHYIDGQYGPVRLESILAEGSSVYRVGCDENDTYELQWRQPIEMVQLFENAINDDGRATQHLNRAWSKCFGRETDPNEACIEASKAVEVAGKQVITPDDPKTTLGKMCGAITDKPTKWETDSQYVDDIQTILHMMRLVWEGHLRHGDENAALDVSEEGAQMIVSTAVLLITWFSSGRIRPKKAHGQ